MRCLVVLAAMLPAAAYAAALPEEELGDARFAVLNCLSDGKPELALGKAKEFLQSTHGHPQAAALVAGVLASEGKWGEADAAMKTAVSNADDVGLRRMAYFQWTLLYAGGGDGFDLARRPADFIRVADAGIEALGGDDPLIEALAHRAAFFFAMLEIGADGAAVSRYGSDMRDWLSEVSRKHPDNAWVHYCLGSLLGSHFGDYTAAVAHLEKAAELEPDGERSKQIFTGLGEALMRAGDASAAEAAFARALTKKQVFGIEDGVIIFNMAFEQALRGRFEEAEANCRKSIEWAKSKYGKDFEYDEAEKFADILKYHREGKTDRMRAAIDEYARFAGDPSDLGIRRLREQLLAAFEGKSSLPTYELVAGGAVVLVLLLAIGWRMRRKLSTERQPGGRTGSDG